MVLRQAGEHLPHLGQVDPSADEQRGHGVAFDGHRLSLLGGIAVGLLTRGTEAQIRTRVREVAAACQPGGGFCLGSGNTVANYIPLDNYLAMLDEGRRL